MTVEVLVATMHQTDASKYREMNLQTNAVIANQADKCAFEEHDFDGKRVRFVTTDTRGASINRNIAITYSGADIIIFSDDDVQFVDGYEKIVSEVFEKHPDADAIKFYAESTNPERPLSYKRPDSFIKATKKSLMSAGVQCLAIKREFLIKHNVRFNANIGPGKEIYCGEDSLFLKDLYKVHCKFYLSPELISYVKQDDSSWFEGFNEQFCISVGYIYSHLYGLLAPLVILRRARNTEKRKNCEMPLTKIVFLMMKGYRQGRRQK